MERQIGIGIVGMGWMGRVHASAYRRLPEHFPDLGVRPRLAVAADVSQDRRRHAQVIGFEDTTGDWRAAVAEAARRAGVVTAVGFCYRFAPAVQHARALIQAGEIGDVNHYRGVFLADYANRPDAAASWRFDRATAGSGALGDLMAHVVDMASHLVGPIDRLSGRTATMIPQRPRPTAEGTHFSRVQSDDLVAVDNDDWAAALFEFAGGAVGSLEASRVIVGPRARMRFEAHGTRGALAWELERMNELERFQLSADGVD